ncbi:hypothetical protein [Lacrimispora sp. JR3]|uniref:hypothetical protein n=1 Tax=Lacrimispora sinapis TaxID=3111456 RepID=UPI0037493C43
MDRVTTLIYTEDLENISFVQECKSNGLNCISIIDARSAVYVATGISAQNQSKVAVCVNAGNASRSAFSGMTEAFYRKLPVALVTVGKKLDYTRELNDAVVGHYTALNYDDVLELLNGKFPMHIELLVENPEYEKKECDALQMVLSSVLDKNTYLYISPGIKKSEVQYMGKVVYGGMPDCYEGAMANVLGASLARIRKKYIGLITEDEFIHDINTLGNINMNDLICYIVVSQEKNKMIIDYATAMKFETCEVKNDCLKPDDMKRLVLSKNKGLLVLYKEG